jgi:serine/threonine protein kinase
MSDILPHQTRLGKNDRGEYLYQIDYPLGRGGFGITYQAIHLTLEKQVAIKEFYPQDQALRDRNTGYLIVPKDKQENYQRGLNSFLKEGKILAKINNNNVVRVENYFEERGTAYLVMELINGETLREKLNSKRLDILEVESIINALVNALTAVHEKEIYHLDLKPDNVLITNSGELKLVDFGASRQGLSSKTTTQAFTWDYAPLEVIGGKNFGAKSDLFELGMMLYEMLTGKLPPRAIDRYHDNSWKPQGLYEPWQTLITISLELDPNQRPSSVKSWWESRLLQTELVPEIVITRSQFEQTNKAINNSENLPKESPTKVTEIPPDEWGRTKGIIGWIASLFDDK